MGTALALATVLSGAPMAYVANGPTWVQAQMSYRLNAANLDLPAAAVEAAVRAGADAWQKQAGAFRFDYAGTSAQQTTTNDGVNLVLFRNASNGSAIATTYWWASGSRIVDADIVFWDAAVTFVDASTACSGGFYIEDTAVHEFGHALGLGHSPSPVATMYASTSACSTQNRTLDADDISGVRALYPPVVFAPAAPGGLRIIG
jgi:poly(3-hydroxybutyrate) depolymerase